MLTCYQLRKNAHAYKRISILFLFPPFSSHSLLILPILGLSWPLFFSSFTSLLVALFYLTLALLSRARTSIFSVRLWPRIYLELVRHRGEHKRTINNERAKAEARRRKSETFVSWICGLKELPGIPRDRNMRDYRHNN